MKQAIAQNAGPIIENVKVQAAAAALTTGFGLGTILEYLPAVLGAVGTMSGIILTWVMICKLMLEIKIKKQTAREGK
jgi:hypothetical protein